MTTQTRSQQIAELEKDWATNPRWKGIKRGYSAADVVRLRGSFPIEHTLARRGAEKLWNLLHTEPYVNCLGALTGGQAMQQVKAGVKAIYLSGWQVAADNNSYASMYPDQSLYPVDSVPTVVERINNTFRRADEIQHSKGIDAGDKGYIDNFAPIVADAEAGFGGVLNAFELMKAMINSGAAGVHWEDQLASVKKCGQKYRGARKPAHCRSVPKTHRSPHGGRRVRRAHPSDCAHRCRSGRLAHQRLRRQRQTVPHW